MTVEDDLIAIKQRLDQHIDEFNEHCDRENTQWGHLIQLQEQNAEAIFKLTESTQGLVEAWEATSGAIKVGKVLSSFVKWLLTISVIGGFVAWILEKH